MVTAVEERCLFIGGPADGQVQTVIAGIRSWKVVEPLVALCTSYYFDAPAGYVRSQEHTYRREIWHCPTKDFAVYIVDGMSIAEAMEQLITAYAYAQRRA